MKRMKWNILNFPSVNSCYSSAKVNVCMVSVAHIWRDAARCITTTQPTNQPTWVQIAEPLAALSSVWHGEFGLGMQKQVLLMRLIASFWRFHHHNWHKKAWPRKKKIRKVAKFKKSCIWTQVCSLTLNDKKTKQIQQEFSSLWVSRDNFNFKCLCILQASLKVSRKKLIVLLPCQTINNQTRFNFGDFVSSM